MPGQMIRRRAAPASTITMVATALLLFAVLVRTDWRDPAGAGPDQHLSAGG
tara:strand:- start:350 stop:502 length:153 start_codon:yes stop_codon:yes gene_type:complete